MYPDVHIYIYANMVRNVFVFLSINKQVPLPHQKWHTTTYGR